MIRDPPYELSIVKRPTSLFPKRSTVMRCSFVSDDILKALGRDFGFGQFLLFAVLGPRQVPNDDQKSAGAQRCYELVRLCMQLRIHQTGHR